MKKILFTIFLLSGFIRNSYADCPSGQGLNGNGVCMNCSGSNQTIKDNKCYTCTGYYRYIKKCEVDNEGNPIVTECIDGYALNNDGVCMNCSGSNQTIKDNKCYTCTGYYRYIKKCEVDEDGNAVIAQCADGLGLNSDNVCVSCSGSHQTIKDNKCYTCRAFNNSDVKKCEVDEDGNAVIAQCADGLGLNSDNVCVSCSGSHQTIKDNKCYTCTGYHRDIKKCEVDEDGNAVIAQCADGLGLNSDNVCVSCSGSHQTIKDNKCYTCRAFNNSDVKKCEVDENGNTFTRCIDGYGWNSANLCVKCDAPNQTIKDNKCYSCRAYNASDVKKCEVDEDGNAVIAQCADGYGLNSDNVCIDCHYSNQVIKDNKCYKCGDFIAGCNTCGKVDEELVCNKCTSGTLTNGLCVGNQNQTCAMDKFLTLAGTCVEKCPIGQYGDKQSGKCQKIAENCAEMLAGTTCKTCDKGFLEKDGYCVSTEVGCGANYIQIENWCNRVRYTPAEAAEIAKDDGNVVTITFKK